MTEKINLEKIERELHPFVVEYLVKKLHIDDQSMQKAEVKPFLVRPEEQSWDTLANINEWNAKPDKASKFGNFTINPDTITLHWEDISPDRVVIERLPKYFSGSGEKSGIAKNAVTVADVAKFVVENYGTTHYIPGIEYLKYLQESESNWFKEKVGGIFNRIQSGDKTAVKDGFVTYAFFGSVIYGKSRKGDIYTQHIPCWTALNKDITLGSLPWMDEHDRFVLIKK
ncbi:MAG: hypothetical protein WCS89_01070 [Candidatus Paceibacterota bacterium]|jgi:hypothetical protein